MRTLLPPAAAIFLLWAADPAAAQDRPPLARADVAGTVGWLAVNKTELDTYNHWHGEGFFTLGAGWYWTDNHKTDVEAGASTTTRTYGAVPVTIGGQVYVAPSRVTFSSRRVSVIQRYQFGRNEWFHPTLGVGVDIARERSSRRDDPVYTYDQVTRQSRTLRGLTDYPDADKTEARALVVGGFKAYLSPQAFFLGEMRVTFASRAEDTLLRFGFGIDLGGSR